MAAEEIETAVQAFAAAGASRGLFYLSTPITTGRRELELMEKLGVGSREELRRDHGDDWRTQVVNANEQAAMRGADLVVESVALGRLVVNPSMLNRKHWTQDDYDALWSRLITEYPTVVIPLEGWAYSRGARLEISLAIARGVPVMRMDGAVWTPEDLIAESARADAEIVDRGWDRFGYVLPVLRLVPGVQPASLPLPPQEAYQRQVMAWLSLEHAYQVVKFGYEQDDRHTLSEGVQASNWWDSQLSSYLHRARILGLDSLGGRQALAKFAATAVGMLESVVRVYGQLPPPGVSSGNLKGKPRRDDP